MLRLYDHAGNPVCGFYGQGHRSKACTTTQAHQYRKHPPKIQSVAEVQAISGGEIDRRADTIVFVRASPATNMASLPKQP